MIYSVSTLQSVADCDEMLSSANNDKAALTVKQTNLQFAQTRYQANSVELAQELPAVQAELDATNTIIATLPDGPRKNGFIYDRRKLENRLQLLNTKKASYGSLALLDKEWELARVVHDLAEVDALIAAVNARKAAL